MDTTSHGLVTGRDGGTAAAVVVAEGSRAVKLRSGTWRGPKLSDPFPWIGVSVLLILPVLRIAALRPLRGVESASRPLFAIYAHAANHREVRRRSSARHWVCPAQC